MPRSHYTYVDTFNFSSQTNISMSWALSRTSSLLKWPHRRCWWHWDSRPRELAALKGAFLSTATPALAAFALWDLVHGSITGMLSLALHHSCVPTAACRNFKFQNLGIPACVSWIGGRWCLIKVFEGSQECSDQQLRSPACKIIF